MPFGHSTDEDNGQHRKRKKESHPKKGAKASHRPAANAAAAPAAENAVQRQPGPEERLLACPYCAAMVKEKRLDKHKRICPKRPEAAAVAPTPAPAAPRYSPAPRQGGARSRGRNESRPFGNTGGGRQRDRRSKKEFGVVAYSETDQAFREAQKRFHEAQAIEEARRNNGGTGNG